MDQKDPGHTLKALVWITHEASQAKRVGTREFDITAQ
jgi:ABC-type iron transport system FetAB ATPase subunit